MNFTLNKEISPHDEKNAACEPDQSSLLHVNSLDASTLHKTVFKKSLAPAGPVTRTVTGPMPGWATNSNVRKGQHSLSATIIFAIVAIDRPSPGRQKAYPSRSSSVPITAELNWARSVAARSRSSALVKQQAIGMSSAPCFMAGSRAERHGSYAGIRPFVRNGPTHAPGTRPPMPREWLPRFSKARSARI